MRPLSAIFYSSTEYQQAATVIHCFAPSWLCFSFVSCLYPRERATVPIVSYQDIFCITEIPLSSHLLFLLSSSTFVSASLKFLSLFTPFPHSPFLFFLGLLVLMRSRLGDPYHLVASFFPTVPLSRASTLLFFDLALSRPLLLIIFLLHPRAAPTAPDCI